MRTAFKEWAIVVDALIRGEQILILRKGGIHEGKGGFEVEHQRFWLFPTLFHQQRESVVPAAQLRYDAIAPLLARDRVRIEAYGEVADWRRIGSLEEAQRLRGRHIWTDEVIAERFAWGKEKNIFALAVRVYRLPKATELPVAAAYGGCKSWIELEADLEPRDATAVLGDEEFQKRLRDFH